MGRFGNSSAPLVMQSYALTPSPFQLSVLLCVFEAKPLTELSPLHLERLLMALLALPDLVVMLKMRIVLLPSA